MGIGIAARVLIFIKSLKVVLYISYNFLGNLIIVVFHVVRHHNCWTCNNIIVFIAEEVFTIFVVILSLKQFLTH